ncbi:MAG: class I SAM-dependent methyltransferase [Rhodoferax sp.]|nr:class I SAM-dependent methyltransferase [Rhodoferax sp.]
MQDAQVISQEDVLYAYRLLLGREPENEEVLRQHASQVSSRFELRELFINSVEFRAKIESLIAPRQPRVPVGGPAMAVDLTAPPDQLSALLAKVSAQWHYLGATEPHWSVLTLESYLKENFDQNSAAFFASGEAEAKSFDAVLSRAGVDTTHFRRCLELGCGVGRVTAALASRFETVQAVDISAAHLQLARSHLAGFNIDNVDFWQLTSVADLQGVNGFDVLYSRIVLQHNPPPVIALLLNQLLAKLRPSGVAFFQVPTYKAGYRFTVAEYLEQKNSTHMEMHYFPQTALLSLLARQNCNVLEIREDDAIGISVNAVSNTLLVQKAMA